MSETSKKAIKRILFFIEQNVPSKFYEAYLQEFARKDGCEFYILNLQSCPQLEIQLKPYIKGYYTIPTHASYRQNIFYIKRTISSLKPDIVHAHETIPAFYACLALLLAGKRTKVIYHRHHSFYHNYKKRIMDQVAFLFSWKVICVSESSKAQAAAEHPFFRKKIIRVYNGVKLYDEIPAPDERGLFEKINGTVGYKILFLARLKPRKGHLLAVDIMNEVTATHPNAYLYIAGDGELKQAIQQYVSEKNLQHTVQLIGSIYAIKPLLSAVDMVILPSESEAFSLTVLETLCAGKLLLASDLPSIREVIKNGETGMLIDPFDKGQWVNNICFYIDHKYEAEKIAQAGKTLFDEYFQMNRMAEAMREIYDKSSKINQAKYA